MPQASKPVTFQNNTTADAVEVNSVFDVLYGVINILDADNMNLDANFDWLGTHSFVQAVIDAIVDDNDLKQLEFGSVASAVNYLKMTNAATGNYPILEALGSDDDVGIVLKQKGAGFLGIEVEAGETPTIEARGADANHDLNLVPKGTGRVTVGGTPLLADDGYTQFINNGSDINLELTNDGSFSDVHATDAEITINVVDPGRYEVVAQFTHGYSWFTEINAFVRVAFRLYDGTNGSPPVQNAFQAIILDATNDMSFVNKAPIHLSGVFNFTTPGNKNVRLQKRNIGISNASSNVLSLTDPEELIIYARRIAD